MRMIILGRSSAADGGGTISEGGAATAALTLEDKLAGQKQVKALEAQRNTKRRALFDAQDEIDAQRERLIAEIEGKLQQKTSLAELFAVRWRLT